jgi:putative MFS transporter
MPPVAAAKSASAKSTTVNSGARLDALPMSSFHRRVLWLIGAGMFFDSFDIYLAGGVLGAMVKSGFSDIAHNASFISATFVGMAIGALLAGIVGDRLGRRFSYQLNLAIFGLASLAAAFVPSMAWLVPLRFVMGVGLGAEIIVGYATLTEFIPPSHRGGWSGLLSLITNSALFVSSLVGLLIIPTLGWQWMFAIGGIGALIVWYLRKSMPESPRWLESKGRTEEAEHLMAAIEAEALAGRAAPTAPRVVAAPVVEGGSILAVLKGELGIRTVVAATTTIGTSLVIYGFLQWIPTFFVREGHTVVSSLYFTTLMTLGGPVGALIGFAISDRIGRKRGIIVFSLVAFVIGAFYPVIGNDWLLAFVGFLLVSMIYLLVTLNIATYIPELFPTEYRLRGAGVANTISRIVSIGIPYMTVYVIGLGEDLGIGAVGGVVAMALAALLVQALVVAWLGIETKQQPLEALAPR